MSEDALFRAAQALPAKGGLRSHRATISLLRDKGYSWREIAQFLTDRGVATDHAAVYRFMQRRSPTVTIPTAEQYQKALTQIPMSAKQREMLEAHYRAPNRTITYTELSEEAEYDGVHQGANLWYGGLGKVLGTALDFTFVPSQSRPDKPFYSSALGMPNPWPKGPEFELVMHHELAKALDNLGWFAPLPAANAAD